MDVSENVGQHGSVPPGGRPMLPPVLLNLGEPDCFHLR